MFRFRLATLLLAVSPALTAADLPVTDTTGCLDGPMAQFGRYIGNWSIADSSLARDGSGWSEGAGANWDFVCVGDGAAVQDFWMPNGGPVGTNLRTYNTDTGSWDIAWAVKTKPGFAHITARQDDDGNIVMHYKNPVPDPPRRITFYPPDEGGWNWTMEFSFDGGDTWTEVYRIRATPRR